MGTRGVEFFESLRKFPEFQIGKSNEPWARLASLAADSGLEKAFVTAIDVLIGVTG